MEEEEVVITGKLDTGKLNLFILDAIAKSIEGATLPGGSGGDGGGGGEQTEPPITTIHFSLPDLNFEVSINISEWNALSNEQKYVVAHTLANYKESPGLKAAFEHLENEQIGGVRITVGAFGVAHNGSAYNFPANAMGAISYASEPGNSTRTDIVPGSTVVLSLNSNHPRFISNDVKEFATAFVHEFMHPASPDIYSDSQTGLLTDHPDLYGTSGYNGTVGTAVSEVFGPVNWSLTLPTAPTGYGDSGNTPDPNGPPQNDEPIGGRVSGAAGETLNDWSIGEGDALSWVSECADKGCLFVAELSERSIESRPIPEDGEVLAWQFPHGDYLIS